MAVQASTFSTAIGDGYGRFQDLGLLDDYYDGSDFLNFGYWTPETRTQREACEQLVDRLLSDRAGTGGPILDVACGRGATTRHLLRTHRPDDIIAINIAEDQLTACRRNAPGCTFLRMDATRLEFEDATFDTVMCVEAAFHFDTRQDFLREARRVLKPGGQLVLSDILFSRGARIQPAANFVLGPHAYRIQSLTAGFSHVEIEDATDRTWATFAPRLARELIVDAHRGRLDRRQAAALLTWLRRTAAALRHYLLVWCDTDDLGEGGAAT